MSKTMLYLAIVVVGVVLSAMSISPDPLVGQSAAFGGIGMSPVIPDGLGDIEAEMEYARRAVHFTDCQALQVDFGLAGSPIDAEEAEFEYAVIELVSRRLELAGVADERLLERERIGRHAQFLGMARLTGNDFLHLGTIDETFPNWRDRHPDVSEEALSGFLGRQAGSDLPKLVLYIRIYADGQHRIRMQLRQLVELHGARGWVTTWAMDDDLFDTNTTALRYLSNVVDAFLLNVKEANAECF
ncbi:MAG: hypothetical protein F4107_14200 [Gemmatimonadetes bacterium]|nr:hypothetical protein [Gemmatimonadota bacterium]MYD14314.1 hypothetical protein [Gemmatimonadota bacterium]MYI67069.1 hypothetical protein [Gemmatimonadota bacterium]